MCWCCVPNAIACCSRAYRVLQAESTPTEAVSLLARASVRAVISSLRVAMAVGGG